MFDHDGVEDASIFSLFVRLSRGFKVAGDIHEPKDVARHDVKYYSLSHRRLTALMMFQMFAPCHYREYMVHILQQFHSEIRDGQLNIH